MRIDALELIWIRMPLVGWFATSRGGISVRNILLVKARSDGLTGWGESGSDWEPYYSYETVPTCWHIIEDFLAPQVFALNLPDVGAGAEVARELSRWAWHPMARAAVEEAVWDLEARQRGLPLHRLYAGERPVRDRVSVGISLGIQEDFEVLAAQIDDAVAQGYARIKLKIEPGRDVDVVREVRTRFGDIPLMVDANCAYDRDGAAPLEALDELGLLMIEQPFGHDDVESHAWLQKRIDTPVCADELAGSVAATTRVLEHDACRIVNIKCSRLGGRANGIAVHDMCAERSVPVWCGGMLESGVGRLHNIAVASLPNFTMPNDLSASRRYWEHDVIDPPVELGAGGTVRVPDGPGLGHEIREEVIEHHLVQRKVLCP